MNVLERLDALLTTIRTAVAASDLDDKNLVTVTDDGNDITKAQSLQAGALIVYPFPAETRVGPRSSRLTWTIAVVADAEKTRASAARTQALLGLLRDAGLFRITDTASPTDFQITDRSAITGYTITHIEEQR